MITALQAASYISQRYEKETGGRIDEMKLHKLLYFAQRESLIAQNEPLFQDKFVAWKYGPVMLCVREIYKICPLSSFLTMPELTPYKSIFDSVFHRYANRSSWSLSILTHGEYSWQKAREGLTPDENGYKMMDVKDIKKDAERVQLRRLLLDD